MFKLAIRDLLWLTLVVAVGLGWFVRERQFRSRDSKSQRQIQLLADTLIFDGWKADRGSDGYFWLECFRSGAEHKVISERTREALGE